jgi:hypothetical protein
MFTFSVSHRDLAWGVALIVLLSAIWVARGDRADAAFGPPGTGIAVVYVAVSTNYPDSLGVGPGAGGNAAPIIIVPTNPPIPAASSAELVRLDPRTVIIVGGTAVISAAMETALGALLPNAVVSRIGGANRYETNSAFSAATFPIEGWASVPAVAFTAENPASTDVIISLDNMHNFDGSVLYAPIQLPHGAEILELRAVGFDNDGGDNFTIRLWRQGVNVANPWAAPTAAEVLGEVSSSGADNLNAAIVSTTVFVNGTVDNSAYAYIIESNASDALADGDPTVGMVMVRYRVGASSG